MRPRRGRSPRGFARRHRHEIQRLDFLVVGDTGEYGRTGKISKAEEYIGRGAHTQIIREAEFFELVRQTKEGASA